MEDIRSEYRQNLAGIVVRQLASHDGMCLYVYQVAQPNSEQWPRFAARQGPLLSQTPDATPSPFKLFEKVKID